MRSDRIALTEVQGELVGLQRRTGDASRVSSPWQRCSARGWRRWPKSLAWLSGVLALQPVPILLGALLFYLSEYGMHRFAFHAPPLSWPPARRLQHRLHYDHHVEPNRLDLLFLPIWFLVPNLAFAAGLFALVFGTQAALSALLGMMLAILHYEWVHYVAHIPYQPRTRLGRWIKQYHLRHHFVSEKHWFGVSNPDAGRRVRHASRARRRREEQHDPQSLFVRERADAGRGEGIATPEALPDRLCHQALGRIHPRNLAGVGRPSTFQHSSMTFAICGPGRMPSARSANFRSRSASLIGFSRLPIACSIRFLQHAAVVELDRHLDLLRLDRRIDRRARPCRAAR